MELITFLEKYQKLHSQEKDLILAHQRVITLPKGEHFHVAGKRCQNIGFVKSGILRTYFYDSEGQEFTKYFIQKGQLAVNLQSFNEGTPADDFLIAETDVTLIMLSKSVLHMFSEKISNWDTTAKKIIETKLLEKLTAKNNMLNQGATDRYLSFMEANPEVMGNVALGHIASYLGITQSTLSRIRRKIVHF
ncbi:MAG TPA: Crp/Fnr family transcriptional regulator [Microscillaceae bacterium]|nr:Crp/Fnr family transcriptional regulator [Microscillaceae bacterium]